MGAKQSKAAKFWKSKFALNDKIALAWTHSHSALHRSLPRPLVTEISEYLQAYPSLTIVEAASLNQYTPETRTHRKVSISTKVIHSVYVSIGASHVFVCGGYRELVKRAVKGCYLIHTSGTVTPMPSMGSRRSQTGVIRVSDVIYAFGGFDSSLMNWCEQFSLSTSKWSFLGVMISARSGFNPVLHLDVIWLCGGMTTNVECFRLRRSEFFCMDFQLPERGFTTSCVADNTLVVVSATCITYRGSALVVITRDSGYKPWSSCPPVLCDHRLFIAREDERCYQAFGLRSAAAMEVYPIPQ